MDVRDKERETNRHNAERSPLGDGCGPGQDLVEEKRGNFALRRPRGQKAHRLYFFPSILESALIAASRTRG
jgi:hypothetical protein